MLLLIHPKTLLVISVAMFLIAGILFILKPKYGSMWGMKTEQSMRNEDTWGFAQKQIALSYFFLAIIFLSIYLVWSFLFPESTSQAIIFILLMIIFSRASKRRIDNEIKKRFGSL